MKKRFLLLIPLGAMILLVSGFPQSSDPISIDKAITKAADLLLGRNQPQNLAAGFGSFLDAVSGLARNTRLPSEFIEKTDELKAVIRNRFEPNEALTALFRETYSALNGKEYETPARMNSIAAVTQMIQRQFEAAAAFNRNGKREDCLKALMDAAMLIVTPIVD
jgi:hypothetical protein